MQTKPIDQNAKWSDIQTKPGFWMGRWQDGTDWDIFRECVRYQFATMAGYSDIKDATAVFRYNPTFAACYGEHYCDGDVMRVCVYNRCNDEKNFIKRIEGCYDNNNVYVAWNPEDWKFIMRNRANNEWSMYPLKTSTTWKDGRWSSRLRVDDQTYSDRLTSYEAYLQRVEARRRLMFSDGKAAYTAYQRTYAVYHIRTITWLSHTYTKDEKQT